MVVGKLSYKMLRELRVRAGLSQVELGEKLNVSGMTISNWENGKSFPKPAQKKGLQHILGYNISDDDGLAFASPIAAWVAKARISQNMSVPELAANAGLTPPAIYRIEFGLTRNLRDGTRQKLEKVLGVMPQDTVEEASEDASVAGLGSLEDFDPHIIDEIPAQPGIYVLYDISERPVYVGEGGNVKKRIQDHVDKFWFKRPIVESASWIKVDNSVLRRQIETILIKFLKSNAVINKQNVKR